MIRAAMGSWILVSVLAVVAQAEETYDANDDAEEFFRDYVEPILVGRCLECHGAERKGKLDLRTGQTALEGGESGPVISIGKPGESRLYSHVSKREMPPEDPLEDHEVASHREVDSRWSVLPGRTT